MGGWMDGQMDGRTQRDSDMAVDHRSADECRAGTRGSPKGNADSDGYESPFAGHRAKQGTEELSKQPERTATSHAEKLRRCWVDVGKSAAVTNPPSREDEQKRRRVCVSKDVTKAALFWKEGCTLPAATNTSFTFEVELQLPTANSPGIPSFNRQLLFPGAGPVDLVCVPRADPRASLLHGSSSLDGRLVGKGVRRTCGRAARLTSPL
ncbi:hypothetical protein AGIG_G20344 [Arapaima gigas]